MNRISIPKRGDEISFYVDYREANSLLANHFRITYPAHWLPAFFKKAVCKVINSGEVSNVGIIQHRVIDSTRELNRHSCTTCSVIMKACIRRDKKLQKATRCAYIQSVSGPTTRPYSVAWISRRLAEPATRVRIAVGPLLSLCGAAAVYDRIFQSCISQFCSCANCLKAPLELIATGWPVIRINHESAIVFP